MELALNNLQRLICDKNPTNQPINQHGWIAMLYKKATKLIQYTIT